MVNEVRCDDFMGRLVIIASGRQSRPSVYRASKSSDMIKPCPFCPGKEKLTPKATLLYLPDDAGGFKKSADSDSTRRSDWLLRVFPNMYPALSPALEETGPEASPTYGYHEVVVETPDHNATYANAEPRSVEMSLLAIVERAKLMVSDEAIKHVMIFKNQGREAGASIKHPHYQIIACTFDAPQVSKEINSYRASMKSGHRCYFCETSRAAVLMGRHVFDENNFRVLTPYASIFPYETLIIPTRHSVSLLNAQKEEIQNLAKVFKRLFTAYSTLLGEFPFNLVFHSGPAKAEDFHWHVEIYPRIAVHAGFELGSGIYINTQSPEEAAAALSSTSTR